MLNDHNVLAVIMAGGAGERLRPLTAHRAKPAVPFGSIYRIIDFTLSNCINSGIRQIVCLTQYKSDSLNRHINNGWSFLSSELGEFIWTLPPQMRVKDEWYLGTADAVFQNIWTMKKLRPKYVVVLAGDHIYKTNYLKMVQQHLDKNADVVVGACLIPKCEASQFGILQVDDDYRIVDFQEKPKENPATVPRQPNMCLGSMGIYCFASELLYDVLEEFPGSDRGVDFGRDILPEMVRRGNGIYAWSFEDENQKTRDQPYWRDVGTLDAYYETNMELASVDPPFNLYAPHWPIRTMKRQLPPAKFVFAQEQQGGRLGVAMDSVVAAGCIVSGGRVNRCLLSPRVRINSYSEVTDSILMEGVEVGRRSKVTRAIIDKYVQIPPGVSIGYDLDEDRARGLTVTESGLVVIGREQEIPADV